MTPKPYTPETLADRWCCSSEKVRQMIHSGELVGFRLGKFIRIPSIEVERFECVPLHLPKGTLSSNIAENMHSRLDADSIGAEFRLARMTSD